VAPKGQLAVDALNLRLCAVEGIELDLQDEWISTRSWWMVGTCVAHARVFFIPFWCHGALFLFRVLLVSILFSCWD
jgi:hypothetical protein